MILVLMFKNANNPRLPAKARWMGLNIAAKKSIAKSVAEITDAGRKGVSGTPTTDSAVSIREHGSASVSEVALAVLEVDGNISVLSNDIRKKTTRRRKAHKIISKQQ